MKEPDYGEQSYEMYKAVFQDKPTREQYALTLLDAIETLDAHGELLTLTKLLDSWHSATPGDRTQPTLAAMLIAKAEKVRK